MNDDDLHTAFACAMDALYSPPPAALGLAVSGGGDSMALLHLAAHWARDTGCALHVATVDHGLRPDAAREAAMVAARARATGATHTTLHWHWDRQGNLQDRARDGRLQLLAGWAGAQGLGAVALGHTRDDQAETVLLRLMRGSGVDGLAAMAPRRDAGAVAWLRPLLQIDRGALRDHLRAAGWTWADDPGNDDPAYDRVRARQAIAALGIAPARLAATAARMAAARDVLDAAAARAAHDIVTTDHGDLLLDRARLGALPADTRDRLVAAALCWVGQARYRPRLAALRAALGRPRATLHGCLLTRSAATLRISREFNAVAGLRAPAPGAWDGRWRLDGPAAPGLKIAALGPDGLAQTDRAAWRLPRTALLASPAVWDSTGALVAAPLAGLAAAWQANCRALPAGWPAAGCAD